MRWNKSVELVRWSEGVVRMEWCVLLVRWSEGVWYW